MPGRPEWQKTMRGTPYIYQGEEIGMTNHGFTDISQYRDVESLNHFEILQKKGLTQADAYRILQVHSRDNGRTPMQKASSPIQILSFPIIRSLFVSEKKWISSHMAISDQLMRSILLYLLTKESITEKSYWLYAISIAMKFHGIVE